MPAMINTLQISEKLRKLQICENYLQYIWEFFRCKVILVICPNAGSAEPAEMTEQANAVCRHNDRAAARSAPPRRDQAKRPE